MAQNEVRKRLLFEHFNAIGEPTMSRSNSVIISLIVAALILIAGIWGLNQAGIISISGGQISLNNSQPQTQDAAATPEATVVVSEATSQPEPTQTSSAETTNATNSASANTTSTNAVPTNPSTAAQILSREKLVVGVRDNLAEFARIDANGEREGLDIDIAREFAKRWLGDATRIEFVSINSANQIPTLVNGDVDLLLAAIGATRDRAQLVDFSQPYHHAYDVLAVPSNEIINGIRGLQDKTVAVIQDGSDIEALTKLIADNKLSITIKDFTDADQVWSEIKAGTIAGVLLSHLQFEDYVETKPEVQAFVRAVPLQELPELTSVGVRKGDSSFRQFVNFTLQDMSQDGTLAAIFKRWMPEEEPPTLERTYGESVFKTLADLPLENVIVETSTINKILEQEKIIAGVVVDVAPFVTTQEDGQLAGFDIDLLHEMAEHWIGTEDAVEIVTGSKDELFRQLNAGEINLVLGGLTPERAWADRIDFSQAYLGPPVSREFVAIAVPQNDSVFRDQVNYLIQDVESDHELETLYERWYGAGGIQYPIEVMPGSLDTVVLAEAYKQQRLATESSSVAFAESAVGRVKKRSNQLVAGVRYDLKPFGYLDESGQPAGFDVDLLNAIAQDWGVGISFVQVNQNNAVELVKDGQIDIAAAGIQIDKEELAEIDYSQSYFIDGDSLLVKRYTGLTGIQDMEGKTVAVLQGSGFADELLAYAATQKINISTVPFTEFNSMIEAVQAGQVDAATAEMSLLRQAVADNQDLAIAGRAFTQEWFGMVLPPGDSNFKNLVDASLQKLKKSGQYDQLYRKWFGRTVTPFPVEIYPGEWPFSFVDSPSVIDTPLRSKVAQILLKKKLVVGVQYDAPPFGYLDDNGQLIGFDIDLAHEFASRWLGDATSIQPVRVSTQGSVESLASGNLDLLFASLVHSWDKEPLIDFSEAYVVDSQRLLVRASDTISTVSDLGGRAVAVINGTATEKNLTELAQKMGIAIEIVPFQELPAAVAALAASQVDAVTEGELALASYASQNPELRVTGESIAVHPLSIGVPNYDKRLHDLVNFTLQEMKLDGSYDRIFAKWFGESIESANIEVWDGASYLRGINLIPMRRIPSGEFSMGNDNGFPDETPARLVNLDTFYIDQYEVTNRQYTDCVSEGACRIPSIPRSVNFAAYYGESDFGNYPVIWVTWQDAVDFCTFAGKRLPTEAEWEKAARGAEGAIYPWGDAKPDKQSNFGYLERDVTSVGNYPQDVSAYGVFDMAGNVREWVADWYQWDYYQSATDQNPTGPRNGVTRVLRGAGWNDTAEQLRLTLRRNFLAESFDSNLGFRCVSSEFPPRR